ncbi:Kazal-type serine protease inhibitor domain [Nesidiocoris tenuis]|uniref:Kazal-type serine protease inhibitor domain n=1 Tax=Nesidiocoris tenuis TaxID=355587 RepID=A0ABN7AFP7_9HEMI|nr:Kazal-type serine protease inhibitor domain [Nesidiocoris tenuis]
MRLLAVLRLCSALVLFGRTTQGGNCWYSPNRSGKCMELLEQMVDKETCCSMSHMATAWSPQDLDHGALFFWRVLGGGVPCTHCKQTCDDIECGLGKRCVMKDGDRPTCVCWPSCRAKEKRKGRVCGTDGRSYASTCRLKKKACRTKSSNLQLAYYGTCKSTCERITCPSGKYCLLDQNKHPHCVRCSRTCPYGLTSSKQTVCGVDGQTYSSTCDISAASCAMGKAIPIAYKGPCMSAATCSSITCSPSQSCLTDSNSGAPRCVTCNHICPAAKKGRRSQYGGPICGSNNRTYVSWCHMVKDACSMGVVIETKHSGSCKRKGKYASHRPHAVKNEVDTGKTSEERSIRPIL